MHSLSIIPLIIHSLAIPSLTVHLLTCTFNYVSFIHTLFTRISLTYTKIKRDKDLFNGGQTGCCDNWSGYIVKCGISAFCYAIERHFWGIDYKTLTFLFSRLQSRINQDFFTSKWPQDIMIDRGRKRSFRLHPLVCLWAKTGKVCRYGGFFICPRKYMKKPITAFLICVLSALRLCVRLLDNGYI